MNKLEEYLYKYDNQTIYNTIFNKPEDFDYEDIDLFHHHLNFMLNNLYNIKIIEPSRKRLNQTQFRQEKIIKINIYYYIMNKY